MKTRRNIIFTLTVVVVAVVSVWVLNTSFKSTIDESVKPIKIGAMLILSGDSASWGQASQRGIEMVVQEVNSKGGIDGRPIEMIYEDTQGRAFRAVSSYNKLTKINSVRAIVGPNFQAEVSAVASLAHDDGMPIVVPSYAPITERPDPRNPLMVWLDPTIETGRLARYVYQSGIESVSVIGTFDSWEQEVSEGFVSKFSALGGRVLFEELLQTNQVDVKTSVTKALNGNPEAVFVGTYYQFIPITKTLNELGYEGKVYSIEVDDYLANETREFTDGLQFISSDSYKENFNKKYEELYGEKPNIPSGQSYDAMNILISFLQKDSTREGVLKQMKEFKSYDGVSGKITVTDDHKTILPTAIYELRNGEIVKLGAYPE